LTQLPLEDVRAEVAGAREDLRRELGAVTPVFAYPAGGHSSAVVRVVAQEGFEAAFTCDDGRNRVPSGDALRLCRTNVSLRTTDAVFRFRLTVCGSYVDQWRHGRAHVEADL
jgi:peptidoglycan/xylan/chitin deacetylase (PgdA/CDA1 family)